MAADKFTYSISIRQFTPLIHFQHSQAGATLRATEVRAALNAFLTKDFRSLFGHVAKLHEQAYTRIIQEVTGDGRTIIKAPYKLWIESQDAQDYLVGAVISGKNKDALESLEIPYLDRTAYFADAQGITDGVRSDSQGQCAFGRGDFSKVRKGLFFGEVKLCFWSLYPELLKLIRAALPYFLALRNFGTRQSKEFGCFFTGDESEFESIIKSHPRVISVYRRSFRGDFKAALQLIQQDYQRLKSGTNFNGYKKSLLWQYVCSRDISWEKRKIKQTLKTRFPGIFSELKYDRDRTQANRIDDCGPITERGEKYQYIRALLGLAEQNEYITFDQNRKKVVIKIEDASNGETIQRLRSPIQFKVIGQSIYLIGWPIPDPIYGREFSFTLKSLGFQGNNNLNNAPLFKLPTPAGFDLKDFLAHACGQVGKLSHALTDYVQLK